MEHTITPTAHSCAACVKQQHCPKQYYYSESSLRRENVSQQIYPHGKPLFHQGERVKHLFYLKSGSVKKFYTNPDGDQQIVNFYFSGEIIDPIYCWLEAYHSCSAICLERSIVCLFQLQSFFTNPDKLDRIAKDFHAVFQSELKHQHETLLSVGQNVAHKRLIMFLFELIDRQHLAHNNAANIKFTMSRDEIANYLGLAPETISRTISSFARKGLISAKKKNLEIYDLEKLYQSIN